VGTREALPPQPPPSEVGIPRLSAVGRTSIVRILRVFLFHVPGGPSTALRRAKAVLVLPEKRQRGGQRWRPIGTRFVVSKLNLGIVLATRAGRQERTKGSPADARPLGARTSNIRPT
jgi:hypothetical protein